MARVGPGCEAGDGPALPAAPLRPSLLTLSFSGPPHPVPAVLPLRPRTCDRDPTCALCVARGRNPRR